MPFDRVAEILENNSHGGGYYSLKITAPDISASSKPGQFLMLGDRRRPDRLRKPYSIGGVVEERDGTSSLLVLYEVIGEGTARLSEMGRGEELQVLGPLGKGFSLPSQATERSLLVGGGIGIPPLLYLAQKLKERELPYILFYGAKSSQGLFATNYFEELGAEIIRATEDGSSGDKGFVTEPLIGWLGREKGRRVRLYSCGPPAMLRAVQEAAYRFGVPHEASVEEYMACGIGVCMGCAVPVKRRDKVLYERACREGPVFDGEELVWEE